MNNNQFLVIIALFLITLGTMCNFAVVLANDGKMPVKNLNAIKIESNDHFSYFNSSDIKLAKYSDIYQVNFKNNYYFFSWGDILRWIGMGIILFVLFSKLLKGGKNGNICD